jgi:hypothetical protein
LDHGDAYRILSDGKAIGGAIVVVSGDQGELEILFVSPQEHSKGIGYTAWCTIEKMYPQVRVWKTCTPCFEKRNIHFYVNRCGFHIVEYFHKGHRTPEAPWNDGEENSKDDEMFSFEKVMF